MRFNYAGKTYIIGFAYSPLQDRRWKAHSQHNIGIQVKGTTSHVYCTTCNYALDLTHNSPYVNNRLTSCSITELNESGDIVNRTTGIAYCNPLDKWTKENGRRTALDKALSLVPLVDREFRAATWAAYESRRNVVVPRAAAAPPL